MPELPSSYRELQAACKRLGLRAVGKSSEMRHRLERHYEMAAAGDGGGSSPLHASESGRAAAHTTRTDTRREP